MAKNDSKKLRLINVWADLVWPLRGGTARVRDHHEPHVSPSRFRELVTISANAPEDKDKTLETLKKKQVAASNYLFSGDDKYKLMDAVDEKAAGPVPHTILIAPGGKVLYRKSGPVRTAEASNGRSWSIWRSKLISEANGCDNVLLNEGRPDYYDSDIVARPFGIERRTSCRATHVLLVRKLSENRHALPNNVSRSSLMWLAITFQAAAGDLCSPEGV